MAKWLKRLALALLVLLLLAAIAAWWLLRGSLPQLDGELSLSGLSAPVSIQHDKLGVVTIEAANETDAMRALGYVHAQERFFEMDLMRRTAAGELAELFGPVAVDTDKEHRVHRFRARVMQNLDAIAGDKLPVLKAYVDGVNAGLADLKVRPWPYLLLRTEPKPWQLADSPLVGYAMYFDLQDSTNARELAMWKIKQVVPPALFALLSHDGTSWDAPLMGKPRGDAVLPTADQLDLRKLPAPERADTGELPIPRELGSNNFAVSGALTKDGRAIVANDMHLTLRAPNIWFRAQLRYVDRRAPSGKVDVGGFTLPGLPLVVVGSNGHVAWGFTNSYTDTTDWIRNCVSSDGQVDKNCDPAVTSRIRTEEEIIHVRGDGQTRLQITQAGLFPVLAKDSDGTDLLLSWTAHWPNAIALKLMDVAASNTADQAFSVFGNAGIPAQNLALADAHGEIGWGIAGPIATRAFECDPYRPGEFRIEAIPHIARREENPSWPEDSQSRHDAQVAQYGCSIEALVPSAALTIFEPQSHRIWTANSRVVDGQALKQVGDGGYVLGARAKQIRDDLFAKQQFTERDLLAIQLDDRALFQKRWWQLLRDQAARTKTPALSELAAAAKTWQGRASIDSVSYRIVRNWRLAVHKRIGDGLTAPAQIALGKDFLMPALPQLEGVAWPLVTQRPLHLLSRQYDSWDALFEDAAREVRDELAEKGPLSERTWGEQNTARICHPLAGALPAFAKRALCMPFEPLPGDVAMPRVQSPNMGASERMVVSPGHEADGIIHMPGGQSGHPLSPFWGAGHDDWVHGRPTPFLPGKAEHTLRITPAH